MSRSAEHLNNVRAFVEVARSGGFLRAAEHLGRTGSAVSKAVQRLEEQLGVRLLLRTTRHISLTEEGQHYLEACERALTGIEAAAEDAIASRGGVSGLLRVQLPHLWGRDVLIAALPGFQRAYPDIELQLVFSNPAEAPINEHIDVEIRVGGSEDNGLVARQLLPTHSWIVGSPGYLERAGLPDDPDDLHNHDCIHFLRADALHVIPWHFMRDGRVVEQTFNGALTLNDANAMREAAIGGLGLVQGPDFLFAEAVRHGQLRRILESWEAPGPSLYLVWPPTRHLPRRARAFIDWVCGLLTRPQASPARLDGSGAGGSATRPAPR